MHDKSIDMFLEDLSSYDIMDLMTMMSVYKTDSLETLAKDIQDRYTNTSMEGVLVEQPMIDVMKQEEVTTQPETLVQQIVFSLQIVGDNLPKMNKEIETHVESIVKLMKQYEGQSANMIGRVMQSIRDVFSGYTTTGLADIVENRCGILLKGQGQGQIVYELMNTVGEQKKMNYELLEREMDKNPELERYLCRELTNLVKEIEDTDTVQRYIGSWKEMVDRWASSIPFLGTKIFVFIKLATLLVSFDLALMGYAYASVPAGPDITKHMAMQYNAMVDIPGACSEAFLLILQYVMGLFGKTVSISGITPAVDGFLKTFFEMGANRLGSGWFSAEVYEPVGVGYVSQITVLLDNMTRKVENGIMDGIRNMMETESWKEGVSRVMRPFVDMFTIQYASAIVRTIPLAVYILYSFYKRMTNKQQRTVEELSMIVEEMLQPLEKYMEEENTRVEEEYDIFKYRFI